MRQCVAFCAALLLGTGAAQARVACPATAPAEWHLSANAPLEQPAVLSEETGHPIDESAPPSLMPGRHFTRDGALHNFWTMGDAPGWSHYVDCRYRGSPRVLRLKADGLKQCEQTVRPRPSAPNAPETQTMRCD